MARTCTKFARYYVRFRSLPWQHRWLNANLKFWIYWVYANPKSLDYSLQLLTLFWTIYASVNSTCAQPPLATAGHLPTLSVPGVGHLQMLHCPGTEHLPIPSFWHARGFLSEYNYTEGFTGKKADWLICQGQEQIVEGCNGMFSILHVCMHFFIAYQVRIT